MKSAAAPGNTIGAIGRGFQQQMMQFQDERLVGCLSTYPGSLVLWERTRQRCEDRKLFGGRLIDMQMTKFELVAAPRQLRSCSTCDAAPAILAPLHRPCAIPVVGCLESAAHFVPRSTSRKEPRR